MRMRSRSVLTSFIRRARLSVCSNGISAISAPAAQPIDNRTTARKCESPTLARTRSNMGTSHSEIETDHLLHHGAADAHPAETDRDDQPAVGGREQQAHVIWRNHVERAGDDERYDADDGGRRLRLHGHRPDLALHLLALA